MSLKDAIHANAKRPRSFAMCDKNPPTGQQNFSGGEMALGSVKAVGE